MIRKTFLIFLLCHTLCMANEFEYERYEGCAYADCRQCCCIGVAVAIGVLMIAGMVAAVGSNSSDSSHSSH